MTLTEFLLARIAEDQERVRGIERIEPDGPGSHATEHAAALDTDLEWISTSTWTDGYRLAVSSARVLAECEAKRGIVDEYRAAVGFGHSSTATGHLERVLWTLAAVYADHPDYRAEWRP